MPATDKTVEGNTGVKETHGVIRGEVVAGAVVGALVVCFCFILAAWFYVRRSVRGKSQIHDASSAIKAGTSTSQRYSTATVDPASHDEEGAAATTAVGSSNE
jgi:flagellar biogenesis protein FliO